jgi:hypothetical protein
MKQVLNGFMRALLMNPADGGDKLLRKFFSGAYKVLYPLSFLSM